MTIQLEIGKTYRNREGDKVKIVGMRAATAYRYQSERGSWYADDGCFDLDQPEHGFDLVEECEADEVAGVKSVSLEGAILAEIAAAKLIANGDLNLAHAFMWKSGLKEAGRIVSKLFAALSVDEVAAIIDPGAFIGTTEQIHMYCSSSKVEVVQGKARDKAQAVMRLLRKE